MWACNCGLVQHESKLEPLNDYCPECDRPIIAGRFFDVEDLDKVRLPMDMDRKFALFIREKTTLSEEAKQEVIKAVSEHFWDLFTNEEKQER